MEPQQHPNEDSRKGSSFVCRQSSTRWSPTTEQIRILKDLYYNNGIRSPSADQIQRISARLRQYGKIEGKNVFYWFQNHKARERQKKRFTTTTTDHHHDHVPIPMQRSSTAWKPDHDSIHKHPNITPAYSPSATGVLTVGQFGSYGYGSMTMERSFRDCSISAYGSSSSGGASESLSHNFGWVGIDPAYSSSCLFDQKKFINGILEDDDEEEEEEEEETAAAPQIETLPLFPLHGDEININVKPDSESCYSGWYRSGDGYTASHRASLELSLNSYAAGRSQDSSI